MDFLTQEIVTELGLTETQVNSIKEKGSNYVAELKQGWPNGQYPPFDMIFTLSTWFTN